MICHVWQVSLNHLRTFQNRRATKSRISCIGRRVVTDLCKLKAIHIAARKLSPTSSVSDLHSLATGRRCRRRSIMGAATT